MGTFQMVLNINWCLVWIPYQTQEQAYTVCEKPRTLNSKPGGKVHVTTVRLLKG